MMRKKNKKQVIVYIWRKKKSFIYDLQVVPINCDYEISSPLMWVVVNIWALPYWTILVLFVYFWNKKMFNIDAAVERFLVTQNKGVNIKHQLSPI